MQSCSQVDHLEGNIETVNLGDEAVHPSWVFVETVLVNPLHDGRCVSKGEECVGSVKRNLSKASNEVNDAAASCYEVKTWWLCLLWSLVCSQIFE